MSLNIKANFTENQIRKEFEKQMRLYVNEIVDIYSRAGKAMAEDARSRTKDLGAHDGGSFGNITWELRSSIGCAVYVDGVKKFSYFPVLSTGAEGSVIGEDYADELSQGMDGIALIVVAGREYAAAVENKGYNVLTSTGQEAEKILQRYIQQAA